MRIGIDLGGTKIEGVALNNQGEVQKQVRKPTPKNGYTHVLDAIVAVVHELEEGVNAHATVGIGTPGSISPHDGRMQNCNNVNLNGHFLREDLEERLERDIRIANDADCFALSEATDGAGKSFNSVFGAIIGTGTGGGFVSGGSLVTGPNAVAGEWGHNPLPWMLEDEYPGPLCYCGKHGCLETYLSGPGLARDHHLRTGVHLEPRVIVDKANQQNPDLECLETMTRFFDRLARGLAMLINTIDPGVIVLGGGLSNIETIYEEVPSLLGNYVFSRSVVTPIKQAIHGDSSGVRGAAWLWPVE